MFFVLSVCGVVMRFVRGSVLSVMWFLVFMIFIVFILVEFEI